LVSKRGHVGKYLTHMPQNEPAFGEDVKHARAGFVPASTALAPGRSHEFGATFINLDLIEKGLE
jgi:hypothetical protein